MSRTKVRSGAKPSTAITQEAAPPWDGVSLGNEDGRALAKKVGAPLSDSDKAFHLKVQDHLARSAGITSSLLATRLAGQIASLQPWASAEEKGQELACYTAIEVLDEFKPAGLAEAMVVVQLWSVHNASTAFLRRANNPEQPPEFVDRNVNRATRLMRLFTEQLEALARLQGRTGQQRMTVEHVHVYPGGQAIVGEVTAPGRLEPGGASGGSA